MEVVTTHIYEGSLWGRGLEHKTRDHILRNIHIYISTPHIQIHTHIYIYIVCIHVYTCM